MGRTRSKLVLTNVGTQLMPSCLQGLFSLGQIVEEGFLVDMSTWKRLEIPVSVVDSNISLAMHLYSRLAFLFSS